MAGEISVQQELSEGHTEKKQKEKLCSYVFKNNSLEKLNSQGNQSVEGKQWHIRLLGGSTWPQSKCIYIKINL